MNVLCLNQISLRWGLGSLNRRFRKSRTLSDHLAHLHMLNRRGKLSLFVGAGISFGCGLPTWDQLIKALRDRAFPNASQAAISAMAGLNSTQLTRLVRSKLNKRYKEAVADTLYAEPYQLSGAVKSIARSGIQRICTYNFDDILEEALTLEGIEFNSALPRERINNNYNGTIIFHPHGLLTAAMAPSEIDSSSIVLSEEDYHTLYSDPYSWSNLMQLSLLINSTCLFAGVSLNDPNLRRLLDVCISLGVGHWHYAIMRSPNAGVSKAEKPLGKEMRAAIEADLRSLHVEPIWIGHFDDIERIFKTLKVKRGDSRSSSELDYEWLPAIER
jgi:hypothetical protein